jgi:hypothetical protein
MIKNDLILNIGKIHTTELGIERIKKNLDLDTDDVVKWCKHKIKDANSHIFRKGKNWYVSTNDCIMTVNANSYTIITVNRRRDKMDIALVKATIKNANEKHGK